MTIDNLKLEIKIGDYGDYAWAEIIREWHDKETSEWKTETLICCHSDTASRAVRKLSVEIWIATEH